MVRVAREIANEDWRILIVLDACRYDYFKRNYKRYLEGDLKKGISSSPKVTPVDPGWPGSNASEPSGIRRPGGSSTDASRRCPSASAILTQDPELPNVKTAPILGQRDRGDPSLPTGESFRDEP